MRKSKKLYQNGQIGKFVSVICETYKLDPEEVSKLLLKTFPELKDKERCANCHANMAIYEHKIDALDALLLFGMGKIVGKRVKEKVPFTEANKVHIQSLLNKYYSVASRTTWCSKLGLIAKVMKKTKSGKKVQDQKAGWCITERGFQFLAGKPVPAKVQTFRNRITERYEEKITIMEIADQESDEAIELRRHKDYPFETLENYSIAGFTQGKLL